MRRLKEDTILVLIPAYNEKFLEQTIESALGKAKNPESIFFGIFNQKSKKYNFENFDKYKNVKSINIHFDEPLGAGAARLGASYVHDGEEFICQIDAHTFFAPNWDEYYILNYKNLNKYIEKPIISNSIFWHGVEDYLTSEYENNFIGGKSYPLRLNMHGDTWEDHSREDEKKFLDKYIEHGLLYAGGGAFSHSDLIYEVSWNPSVMFLPEQELTALRACTRGYRIFSTEQTVLSTLGKSSVGFDKDVFIDDFKFKFNQEKQSSHFRGDDSIWYSYLLGLKFGWYGAPSQELYDDYVKRTNVDYRKTFRESYIGSLRKYNEKYPESSPDIRTSLKKSIY